MPATREIINKETNARFWAQTGYKPGQKLDPMNPTDAAMAKIWMDIFRKVQREDAAGKLVTTYDQPVVAQNLSDASVANRAAAAHLDAAAKTPDSTIVQQNIAAATTAAQIASQKTREAATIQPTSISPKLAQAVAHEVAQTPPSAHAPSVDQLAHAQTQTLKPPSRDVLIKETNARFWAQTHYKPGQKLDPKIPTDKTMMPVWMDIFRKVQREADAGKLVTTYDKPGVAQSLADAELASKAAAALLDAAAAFFDPAKVAAAATAEQVAAQKAHAAAAEQPPTVSPQLSDDAAREAARKPPPAHASSADQIAHAKTQAMKPTRDVLIKETNIRFWMQTGYKPGQKLDMSDPTDRKMAKVWMDIFRAVQREAAAGTLVLTRPTAPPPPRPMPPRPTPPRPMPPRPMPPKPPSMRPPTVPPVPTVPMPPSEVAPPPKEKVAPPPEEKPKWSTTSKIIAAALIVGGGAFLYGVTRKPRKSSGVSRPRAPRPRVFVATPTPMTPAARAPSRT